MMVFKFQFALVGIVGVWVDNVLRFVHETLGNMLVKHSLRRKNVEATVTDKASFRMLGSITEQSAKVFLCARSLRS